MNRGESFMLEKNGALKTLNELTEQMTLEISKKVIRGKEKAESKSRLSLLKNIFLTLDASNRTEEQIISQYYFMRRFEKVITSLSSTDNYQTKTKSDIFCNTCGLPIKLEGEWMSVTKRCMKGCDSF